MSVIRRLRNELHQQAAERLITVDDDGTPSMADRDNRRSIEFAQGMIKAMGVTPKASARRPGQTSGSVFEELVMTFMQSSLERLNHLRPGKWEFSRTKRLSEFDQYRHLSHIEELRTNPATRETYRELRAALGTDHTVKPDLIAARLPEPDEVINEKESMVDETVARRSPLRESNRAPSILHASVSCKFTIRSDRAQNSRLEALNLIRYRKGRVPHVLVVTAEPLPTRIAAIALGTGDIDCTYHLALPELRRAIAESDDVTALELLDMMIDGNRLRDISDLPLDLVV